jgi:deoxyribodipyrimidine photo-lyase
MLNIFWFRRDLRLEDNTGLYHAFKYGLPVLPLFIFDENILQKIEDKSDARVTFIFDELLRIKNLLEKSGSSLLVRYGKPEIIFRELISTYSPQKVYCNHDYEPYARERDSKVERLLHEHGIFFHSYKDQVIFEKDEVVKDSGEPYTVFTPYSRKWKSKFASTGLKFLLSEKFTGNFVKISPLPLPELPSFGFIRTNGMIPEREIDLSVIKDYHLTRDLPSLNGTSRLGIHLRFGTISVRRLVKTVASVNEIYLNELIWREFYMMILWHFPHVEERSFKAPYDLISWRNDERDFAAWCEGSTGFPIVDAGMRELNRIGYMHNRLRMITASFLTKHLLIDWRWGEAYFAKKLLDYELASNNGGWQWAAGTGCDAAPYFRVFNPELQTEKFDPEKKFIREWVPEFDSVHYPRPIVNHSEARIAAIAVYKKALGRNI